MRLTAPRTPAPGGGVEPAVRYDFLSSDEFRGMGGSLFPAATPPVVNNGLVLNGATQYARARNKILLPQQITIYAEFTPAFAYDANITCVGLDGDSATTRVTWMKLDNANFNRLYCIVAAGVFYVNGADYGANWRQNQRNKTCFTCISGAGRTFLNGVQYATANVPFTTPTPTHFFIGSTYAGGGLFQGTIYETRIYTRAITVAEAIEMTTLT